MSESNGHLTDDGSGNGNPLGSLNGYLLRRASALVMADLSKSLQPVKLRASEASILIYVAENPGVSLSEVGRELGIKRANLGPIVKILEARGCVKKGRIDGRTVSLFINPEQAELPEKIRSIIDRHELRCFSNLSKAESVQLRQLLGKIGPPRKTL